MICDRYVVDWAVYLRLMYASGPHLPAHAALIRPLSPMSTWTLFDVDPGNAFARKGENDPEPLDSLARLYLGAARGLGIRRLDGGRTCEDPFPEIGADARRARP